MSLSGMQGGRAVSQSLSVGNDSGGTLSWTASSNASWLGIEPASGTAPSTVQVTAEPRRLPVGSYTGAITISAAGATNTPQKLTVSLTVNATPPKIQLTPTSMSFSAVRGGSAILQSLSVINGGGGTLSWTASSNASWLSIQPASGTAPTSPQVTASPNNLQVGSYNGQITISASGATNTPQKLAVSLTVSASGTASTTLTGTHWVKPSDFPALKIIGYDYAVTDVNVNYPSTWTQMLDAAHNVGIKLILGLYPAPYTLNANGTWSISSAGVNFLHLLASRSSDVMGVFVYNEPYYVNPFTHATNKCGAVSASQLRALRTTIQAVWPGAKIYYDIGEPSQWAPGGKFWSAYSCIGNKYADQTGVADFVGTWCYPFNSTEGYAKDRCLNVMSTESNFITTSMFPAVPVGLDQSFRCNSCGHDAWPTLEQIKDWNCSTRRIGLGAISWYVWRQTAYDDYLSNHPQDWPLTIAAACN
ncbi:MAG: BACON domain-containing protein [Acidobacteria bacterium]|nr:BACON domain-containing protein [Acidobacteriota bacterium]